MTTQTPDLAAAIAERSTVYLLTVDPGGRPHAAEVYAAGLREEGAGATLTIRGVGRTARGNIEAGSPVSLMWPPATPGGYTLFANGTPHLGPGAGHLTLAVARAVLHRPGAGDQGGAACGSDCVPLLG